MRFYFDLQVTWRFQTEKGDEVKLEAGRERGRYITYELEELVHSTRCFAT